MGWLGWWLFQKKKHLEQKSLVARILSVFWRFFFFFSKLLHMKVTSLALC